MGGNPATVRVTLVLAGPSVASTLALAPAGTRALSYVANAAGGAANVPLAVTVRAGSVDAAGAPVAAPPQATRVMTHRAPMTAVGEACMLRG